MSQANPSSGALQWEGLPCTAASYFVLRMWLLYRLFNVSRRLQNFLNIIFTYLYIFFTFILYFLRMGIDFPQLKKCRCDSSLVIDRWCATILITGTLFSSEFQPRSFPQRQMKETKIIVKYIFLKNMITKLLTICIQTLFSNK